MDSSQVTVRILDDPSASIDDLLTLRTEWAAEQDRPLMAGDTFAADFTAWVARESDHRRFWLALNDDVAVGMVNLLVFDRMPTVGKLSGGWGYLCNMYVHQQGRNLGLGAQLATAVLDHADALGLERVVLSPSERSRPFYASLGFAPASNLLLRPRPL